MAKLNQSQLLFTRDTATLFRRALMRWGERVQTDQAIEEMAELIKAILKTRNRSISPAAVVDEIADVTIMCAQLRMIYGPDLVDSAVLAKVQRLTETLDPKQEISNE